MIKKITRYSIYLLIIVIHLISCNYSEKGQQRMRIDLNENWKFRLNPESNSDKIDNKWYDAFVPGCVHIDLLKNKLIKSPFYRSHEKDQQWIEIESWDYELAFALTEDVYKREHLALVFEGLDTYAHVYLNDTLLLKADNMFRTWTIPCKHYLKVGENQLRITFQSPTKIESSKAAEIDYALPDIRGFTRKAPYQYGWDWGPRFVTSGIWRSVFLDAWDIASIENIQYVLGDFTESKATYEALVTINASRYEKLHLKISDQDYNDVYVDSSFEVSNGHKTYAFSFDIYHPKRWWPNGLGKPHLYHLRAELKHKKDILDRKYDNLGVRSIELITEKDKQGESFHFMVNGHKVFIKGANFIPADHFLTRLSRDRYHLQIDAAAEANMNMLRVWGGGIYEDDRFYDLCDQHGIMVWQDFMFACNMYPGDQAFLENVREEASQNIIRLRNHPCIALWCGNNEVDEGWHNWGWQNKLFYSKEDSAKVWKDYEKIFHHMLPSMINSLDHGRPYWPTSPKHGWGHQQAYKEGDVHYWGVWWGEEKFSMYEEKIGRFMSEYGFQGFPDLETIYSFTAEKDRQFGTEVLKSHQKHPKGFELIAEYMQRDYHVPDNLEDYTYISQLLQAEGIDIALQAHRRAMPYCMGTLYWQLNDSWPVISWSSIDYYARWKALHYFVKNTFRDILVSVEDNEKYIHLFIVSDRLNNTRGQLAVKMMDFTGKVLWQLNDTVTLPANTSKKHFSLTKKKILKNLQKNQYLLYMVFIPENEKDVYSDIYYFVPVKELALPEPDYKIKEDITDDGRIITIKAENLLKNVCLRYPGNNGSFSDNYMDILPGQTKIITYIMPEKGKETINDLEIKTLKETY